MNFRFSDLNRFLAHPEIPCTQPGFGGQALAERVMTRHTVMIRASVLPFTAGAPRDFLELFRARLTGVQRGIHPGVPARKAGVGVPLTSEDDSHTRPVVL